ncbi:hypothetical protein ABIA52_000262 [Paenarthrobacter histidinolovorans]|uniref:Uncharacterized protein n=1 Tax=Paenarthrobacter histidinolovorans TaxID=43664 RepID=A0ABW8N182_9MICC
MIDPGTCRKEVRTYFDAAEPLTPERLTASSRTDPGNVKAGAPA